MATIKYNEDEQGNKKIIVKTDPETDQQKVSCGCCACGGCGTIESRLGDQAPSSLAIIATTPFTLIVDGPPVTPANGSGSTDGCAIGASNCPDGDIWLCYENFGVILNVSLNVTRPSGQSCGFYISASLSAYCGAFGGCSGGGVIGPIPKESVIGTHTVPMDFVTTFYDPETGEQTTYTTATSVTVTIS